MIKKILIGLFVLACAFLLSGSRSKAATPRLSKGISVSPAYQQVSLAQGVASQQLKFTIINHEGQTQSIRLSTQDFNTLGDTGGLVFVGSNPTQLQKKYGLAKWMSLDQTQITVEPGHAVFVTAKILNLPGLTPGGHYGAIMLAINNGGQSGGVSLHPIASSLLFVTKVGGDTHKLALAGVHASHSIFSLPGSVTLRFHNDGNSHVVPRGLVSIVDSKGDVIRKGIINQNSDIILPETFRKLSIPLQTVGQSHQIGKYKLLVDFRFDGYDQFRRYQSSLWVLPWYFFVVLCMIILGSLVVMGIINLRSWH